MTIRKLLNYWFGKKRSGFYIFWGFLFGAGYLGGILLCSSVSQPLSRTLKWGGFIGFLINAMAFFVHMNLHACHWFLGHFQDTDHLPAKQINLVNSFCLTLFLTLCAGVLPGAAWGLEPLWQAIGQWFARHTSLDQAVYPALNMEPEAVEAPDLSALLGQARPTPQWLLTLDELLRGLAYIMLIVLGLLAIRGLCRGIWRWITKPRQFDSDEKIYLTPSWSLASDKKKPGGKRPRLRSRSYSQRVRRHYRKRLLSLSRKKKIPLSSWASPEELERAVGLNEELLHRIYEKARYGKEECGRGDWETVLEAERRGRGPSASDRSDGDQALH